MWAIVVNGQITQTLEEPRSVTIKGTGYPKDVFTKWTPEELLAVGIYEVRYTQTEPPEGQKVLKQEFQIMEDFVLMYDVFVAITPDEASRGLQEAKRRKFGEVNIIAQAKLDEGMPYGDKIIPLDATNIAFAGLRMALVPTFVDVTEYWWVATDNTLIQLTKEGWISLCTQVEQQLTAWALNAQRHREQIAALTTIKAVEAYDPTTGW